MGERLRKRRAAGGNAPSDEALAAINRRNAAVAKNAANRSATT